MAQLDGLRAIAVGLVVIWHEFYQSPLNTYFSWWATGPAGVRLFFVLSGFLITGILLRAKDALGVGGSRLRILRAFYIRRVLRIFPLAYLALLVAAICGDREVHQAGLWYVLYLANVHVARVGDFPAQVGHFWSLAVEEQFYLFWPAMILLVSTRRLVPTMIVIIVVSGLSRGWYVAHHDIVSAYVLTPPRLDALAFGGLLSIIRHRAKIQRALMVGAVVAIGSTAFVPLGGVSSVISEWGAIALCGLIVTGAATGFGGLAGGILLSRPLRYIGTISYGVYVWHPMMQPAVLALGRALNVWTRFPVGPGVPKVMVVGALSVGVASLSWRLVERPINNLKSRFPYVPAATGGAGPVAISSELSHT